MTVAERSRRGYYMMMMMMVTMSTRYCSNENNNNNYNIYIIYSCGRIMTDGFERTLHATRPPRTVVASTSHVDVDVARK